MLIMIHKTVVGEGVADVVTKTALMMSVAKITIT